MMKIKKGKLFFVLLGILLLAGCQKEKLSNADLNDLSQSSSEENWEYLIYPGEYEEIKLVNSNLIAVKDESGNYGIINREKDAITDFKYFNVWGDEESILVMDQNRKFSILDCEGNLITKETYDRAELFCEDLAAVRKNDKWGFIDREGNLVIDCQYDNIYGGVSEGLMAVEKEGIWRFIDTDGEWVFGMEFENAHTFSDGLAAVMQNGVWGFIDLDGKMVIEGQYADAGDFREGLAAVCKEIDGVRQWGYIDKNGNVCIDFQPYDVAEGRAFIMGEFHDDYAIVTDSLYCLIDKNGQYILGKEECFLTGGFDYREELGVIPAYDYVDEDMMIKKYGFVDINGNRVIPFIFYNISDIQGDLAAVATEDNMRTNGVIVLKNKGELVESGNVSAIATDGEEKEDIIYYVRDQKVDKIDLFSDFLNGKTAAYDGKQQKDRYCTDYYEQFMEERCGISAIEITAEDIDEDGKDELLMIVMYTSDRGDLYVFHEQEGKLYTWEVLEDFFTMRVGTVYLLGNGIFEFFGGYGQGHFFKQYNEKGEVEDVLDYYYNSYPWEDSIRYDYVLTLYEQGVSVRKLHYSIIASLDKTPDKGELLLGTKEEQAECNRILNEFYEESERVRCFKFPQYEDNVEEIPLSSVLGGKDGNKKVG